MTLVREFLMKVEECSEGVAGAVVGCVDAF
jgi:hypothetical protein